MRNDLPGPQNAPAELFGHPGHFRHVIARFAGDENVLIREGGGKSVQNAAGASDDVLAERGVGFIQPRGEPDAAGERIELGNGHAVLGEHEIRPEHAWEVVSRGGQASEAADALRFALIEQFGDPGVLFIEVERIAGALKGAERGPERANELHDVGRQRKGLRGEHPLLFREEALRRKGGADLADGFKSSGGHAPAP